MGAQDADVLAKLYSTGEHTIIDDLPYTLQGIETEHHKWIEAECALLLPVLGLPLLKTAHSLAEPAILYKWLRSVVSQPPNGLVTQALFNSIDEELQQYLIFIGAVEKRVRARTDITLSDCVVMLQQPVLALRLLYTIVLECQTLVGGQIMSLLHRYTRHGNQFVSSFCQRLLDKATVPFDDFLSHWVGSGTLNDPYGEFFVQVADVQSRWSGRFDFVSQLVPESMKQTDAKRAFDVGKALYFLRSLCNDDRFIVQRESKDAKGETLINQNFNSVIEHVNNQLATKFELSIHLQALKDYMLLNKGDFVENLLRECGELLAQPAENLVRHQLTTALETAIYTSNAQFDPPQVLKQLDARMLGLGEMAWQVFTIHYQVPSPLDVIVDERAMRTYLQIFNFLWRVRYASFALSNIWRSRIMSARGSLKALIVEQGIQEEWQSVVDGWQIMTQFVNELQLYIYTEVIQGAWKTMNAKLAKLATLDEIIKAHRDYLETIKSRIMFGAGETVIELQELLNGVLEFCRSAANMHIYISHRQVDRQREAFTAIYDQVLQSQAQFVSQAEKLLMKLDQDNQSFSTRLNFNSYYQL